MKRLRMFAFHSKSNNTICRRFRTILCQTEIFIDFYRFSEVSILKLSAMGTQNVEIIWKLPQGI